MPKSAFKLSQTDRKAIRGLLSSGRCSARVLRRANILRLSDEGYSYDSVAHSVGGGTATVGRTLRRYRLAGLDKALNEMPRTGRPAVYGFAMRTWTLRLLAEYSGLEPQPSRNTVSLILKADGMKPWREKNVVRSRSR
jgi:transposase